MPLPHVDIDDVKTGSRDGRGAGQVRLLEIRGEPVVLAQDAVDVVLPRADQKVGNREAGGQGAVSGQRLFVWAQLGQLADDVKGGVVEWSAARSDDVGGFSASAMRDDVVLLVPVGVELHPSLLHAHAAEMLACIECVAAAIALHTGLPVRGSARLRRTGRL